ncbi:MAG: M23 family metallopeptidase [Verrucomicrobiales bacterium]|nr:M23 family metallopeptidase [Verrucomicrobiales bacterium]MCP5560020.1 M23 family metallopeptidase [Verrucomicrobiaceae bacterium]
MIRYLRPIITLLAAAAIILSIWQRLAPRFQDLAAHATVAKPLDTAFARLTPLQIASLPEAVRFETPMGSEHGALTYNAQPFRITRHLGDDLNGIGGMNSDLGDPVYAAGAGRVVYRGIPGDGWGNMVIIAHRVAQPDGTTQVIQSVYAHLDESFVTPNQTVQRGDQIGTVGTAFGAYPAHLHFEIRRGPYIHPGVGYADNPLNRLSPDRFVREHQGAPDTQLNPAPQTAQVEVEMISEQ